MYKNREKRTLVIICLTAVLVCMTIGYAAFQTQLNITGTSTIASKWDVQITGISSGTPTGTGENAVAPSYTGTTANMEANLYAPGDAMTYDITIKNNGTIDAVLSDIIKSNSNNPAILFETSGVSEGDVLKAGETALMTVKISYADVTSQPSNLSGEMSITLNYTQNSNGGAVSDTTPPIIEIDNTITVLEVGETLEVKVDAIDDESEIVKYEFAISDVPLDNVEYTESGSYNGYIIKAVDPGEIYLYVRVTNSAGLSSESYQIFTIEEKVAMPEP